MTSQEQVNQQQPQQQWTSPPPPPTPVNPIPTPVVATPVQPPPVPAVAAPQKPIPPVKSANFDLLSDIDFSINTSLAAPATPTLQPLPARSDDQLSELSTKSASPAKQVEIAPVSMATSQTMPPLAPIDRKPSVDNISICSDVSSIDPNFDWESASLRNEEGVSIPAKTDGVKYKDAFDDPKVVKWFHKEVERLERFIETSTIKTLNGTTPLDGKWKELQDALVKDESKRVVNVARLFPEKNRSIDSIPYDHARVSLGTPTDDYINAGYVKVSTSHVKPQKSLIFSLFFRQTLHVV